MFFLLAISIIILELIIVSKLLLKHKELDIIDKRCTQVKTPYQYADSIRQVLEGLRQIHDWNRPEFDATSTEIMTCDVADRLIEKLEELIKRS
jgi:hypothetical protein